MSQSGTLSPVVKQLQQAAVCSPMSAGQADLFTRASSLSYSQITDVSCSSELVKDIRTVCLSTLGVSPCLWQIRVALAILKAQKDIICVARTGAGKSLTFYIPLVVKKDGIIIIIVPLNALASEMASRLSEMGLAAIAIVGSSIKEEDFKVS